MSQSSISIQLSKERLEKRLARLNLMKDKLKAKHDGREIWFTYYGGWDMGYLQGQLSILEEMQDLLIEENCDGSEESRT